MTVNDCTTIPHSVQSDVPFVSVIIPMLNELKHIDSCIGTFDRQTYPVEAFEVLIVDGGSSDGSSERVDELTATRGWLRRIDNPATRASSAFNRGLEASKGSIICIVGAHAEVGADFISMSVNTLHETGAAGVGGSLLHEGNNRSGKAIGLAMTSKFGMASPFRFSTHRQEVDTIGHPAYRKEVLDQVGPFNESLERNSDYELNYRIRAAGYKLIFDPNIQTIYRPRESLKLLAQQFYNYGKGKCAVARLHPRSLRARHLIAPIASLVVLLSPLLARCSVGRRLLAFSGLGYAGLVITSLSDSRPCSNNADLTTYVIAFPVMHFSWGIGFLIGSLDLEIRE